MIHSSVKQRGFSFTSGGMELRGISVLPCDTPDTAVILIHGWGTCRIGSNRLFVHFSERIASRGFGAFRFDLPGRGESEGEENSITIDDMALAAADCVRYVKKTYPSVRHIGLAGICSGGNTAVLASAEADADFLILWSTFLFRSEKSAAVKTGRTRHFLTIYFRKLFSVHTWRKLLAGALNFRLVLNTLFGHYRGSTAEKLKTSSRDAMKDWGTYRGRVLFVYGEHDPEAPDAQKEYRTFCADNNIRAEFVDIPGASHNFYRKEWKDELLRVSTEWISSVR